MIDPRNTFAVPTNDKFNDGSLIGISQIWLRFFIEAFNRLMPLGVERSFSFLANGTAQKISGMQFSSRTENAIFIDYFIQRISLNISGGASGQEKNEIGMLMARFNPRAKTWTLNKPFSDGTSDCTFTISNDGQISVSGSALTGVQKIDKITWRARSLGARLLQQTGWDA